MTDCCEDDLINGLLWIFLGVTSSGQYVWRDESRSYLYIPAGKKNKIVSIKQ